MVGVLEQVGVMEGELEQQGCEQVGVVVDVLEQQVCGQVQEQEGEDDGGGGRELVVQQVQEQNGKEGVEGCEQEKEQEQGLVSECGGGDGGEGRQPVGEVELVLCEEGKLG